MIRTPLSSSNVSSAGYDARRQILEVEFKGSRVYHYTDVPPDVFAALMSAPSPGQYVNSSIAYVYNYEQGPAPEESLLEDAFDEITSPEAIAEDVAEAAIPEASVVTRAGLLSRFVGALRRALPW